MPLSFSFKVGFCSILPPLFWIFLSKFARSFLLMLFFPPTPKQLTFKYLGGIIMEKVHSGKKGGTHFLFSMCMTSLVYYRNIPIRIIDFWTEKISQVLIYSQFPVEEVMEAFQTAFHRTNSISIRYRALPRFSCLPVAIGSFEIVDGYRNVIVMECVVSNLQSDATKLRLLA